MSLGAGGIGLSQAAINSGEKPVYVSITPCRLIDTRGNVGDRTAPLSGGDTLTLQITGSTGECTGIPADAVAAAMNVTAIRGTTRSFLTVYPQDAALPNASNLNWNGGDPPTPNKVDVALSASGAVKMTNDAGTVHIAADLVGYYTDHTHDDRYYTKGQSDGRYAPRQTVVVVDPLDFVLLGTNWTQGGDVVARGGGGASSCIQAPLELPVGASLESVTLAYLTFGATVDVVIGSYSRVAGPFDADLLVSGPETVPFVGEFTLGEASIPIDDTGPIVAGRSYYLEVCSGATFWLSAVEITHS